MQGIGQILSRVISSTSSTPSAENKGCPLCGGQGYTVRRDENGMLWCSECKCSVDSRNRRRLERSGLGPLAERYTLERYETPEKWQKDAKSKAEEYIRHGGKNWFFICGTPGSGKTHLCTGIISAMINGGMDVKYMLWRDDARKLKALVTDRDAYEDEVRIFKTVQVLYIDDFFKGTVSDGDKNLAFDIINARYNANLPTIISGERSIESLCSIDEAIGSRIYERSKAYAIATPRANWRLK